MVRTQSHTRSQALLRLALALIVLPWALASAPAHAQGFSAAKSGKLRAALQHPPFLAHTEASAQVKDALYSANHPAARARGWWPLGPLGQPLPHSGREHIVYAQGNTWGGPPFFHFGPDTDTCLRVQAVFSEFRRHGWAAWQVNYPVVAGSQGEDLHPGPPSSWPEIPRLLAESISWLRSEHHAETVIVIGQSAGGISWGFVCGQPDDAYPFPDWRPDALITIDSAPSLNRLALDTDFYAAAYLNGASWSSIPLQTKLLASSLPNLASGPGAQVPVVAAFPAGQVLPSGMSKFAFMALWDAGLPIPGYGNPHGAAGGLGLEHEFRGSARAPYRVHWGDANLNPTGFPGLNDAGEDPVFAHETRQFLEAALWP